MRSYHVRHMTKGHILRTPFSSVTFVFRDIDSKLDY